LDWKGVRHRAWIWQPEGLDLSELENMNEPTAVQYTSRKYRFVLNTRQLVLEYECNRVKMFDLKAK
jgi:hypothetical protein